MESCLILAKSPKSRHEERVQERTASGAIKLLELLLKQVQFCLDDGWTERKQGKKKFHNEYETFKKILHQLDRQFEGIQESKQILEREIQEFRQQFEREISVRSRRTLELLKFGIELNSLYHLNHEFEQKLWQFKRCRKKILLRVTYLDSQFLVWLLVLCAVHAEDAHEGGGFRNLALDSWWLEFWEIVLLAAGDVERNPGPRQITDEELAKISHTAIEEDNLTLVFDAVLPVSAKWSRLCCYLGLRASLLDAIEKNHPGDVDGCLFEGLKQWILKNYDTTKHGLPTWRRLVEAVDDSSGGHNHALALEIAEKHKVPNDPTCVAARPRKDNIHDIDREDLVKRHRQSAAFSRMFSSITRLLGRSMKVADLKQFLRYFSNPLLPSERYVDPGIYESTKSRRAKDIFDRLYPDYINPENTFLLEEIVRNFGSLQSKKCLEKYTSEYH